MPTAFLLGAGLGTRLRPLTDHLPKPLVPVWNKPLVEFAMDHLIQSGFDRFLVNTHHCPEQWGFRFGGNSLCGEAGTYRGLPVLYRHEPTLLDTGGGLKNIKDLSEGDELLAHNGDILADLPLDRLLAVHRSSGNLATMLLRSAGGPLQVRLNPCTGLVEDIRDQLGNSRSQAFLFTGITMYSTEIFRFLPADRAVFSIIPVLLDLIRAGRRVGGVVEDSGLWMDLGTREVYLDAHREIQRRNFAWEFFQGSPCSPSPIPDGVHAKGSVCIGRNSVIGSDSTLEDCVIWDHAEIASRSHLRRCIVRDNRKAEGNHEDAVF